MVTMDHIRRYFPAVAHGFVFLSTATILLLRRYRARLLELRSPPGCQHITDPLPLWHMEPTVRKRNLPGLPPTSPDLQHCVDDDYARFCLSKFVACLHEDDSKRLFKHTTIQTLSPGSRIFQKGDCSLPGLVLVLTGSVQLFITGPSGELEACGSMRAGHSLGAFDVIDSGKRCVTARVSDDSEARLAFLSQEVFWNFFDTRPVSILQYIKIALSRLWRISQFMLGEEFLNISFPDHGIDVQDVTTDVPPAVLQQLSRLPPEHVSHATIHPGFIDDNTDDDAHECWAMLAVDGSFVLNHSAVYSASRSSPVLVGMAGLLGSSEVKLDVKIESGGLSFIRLTLPILERLLRDAQKQGDDAARDWTGFLRTGAKLLVPIMRFFAEIGMQRVWRRSGDILYKAGDINTDGVMVIITGRVRIEEGKRYAASMSSSASQRALESREQSVSSWFCEPPLTRGNSRKVSHASRKSVLGVRSYSKSLFSSGSTHASSAVCARDSEFVRISPATVRVCTRLVPDFPWRLLNNNSNSVEQQLVTIAAIPLNKSSSALSQKLVQELAIALSPGVKVITEVDLELRFGKDALANLHLPFFREEVVQFLNHAEEQYKLVILFANSVDSKWASIAVASADMTLLLATFHSPTASADEVDVESAVSDGEQNLINDANHGRYELVFLHTSESPPRNTRKWLISRDWLFAHHHIRMVGSHQQTNDIYRLSRRIAGLSVGLVLSGGGGKGLAHYGLFQAIEQNKLPVDFVGGTSQGAFMGALYCITESSEKMRPFVLRLSAYIGSTVGLVSDFTLPFSAFFAGKEFSLAVRDALGPDAYIEDLWLPFYCVSTNLSS